MFNAIKSYLKQTTYGWYLTGLLIRSTLRYFISMYQEFYWCTSHYLLWRII